MLSTAPTIGIQHPAVGLVACELFQLRLLDQPQLLLVVQVPASREDATRLAALVTDD